MNGEPHRDHHDLMSPVPRDEETPANHGHSNAPNAASSLVFRRLGDYLLGIRGVQSGSEWFRVVQSGSESQGGKKRDGEIGLLFGNSCV